MHPSALRNAKRFFQTYTSTLQSGTILDIGSQDVNGSLRDVAPKHLKYVGIDFVAGKNVDLILDDPYVIPLPDESVDVVVSSSCFEHSEMFWVLFLETLRVLRPSGLLYLNAPSNGGFHRWPVDCWRFYPDSGKALVTWAKRNNIHPQLLESFISEKHRGMWNDFVAVYVKDEEKAYLYPDLMLKKFGDFTNGRVSSSDDVISFQGQSSDQRGLLGRLLLLFWGLGERSNMEKIRRQ